MTDLLPEPAQLSDRAPQPGPGRPARRSVPGTLRWSWRTLTSMRTALLLLLLLALAAIPGSLLPQRGTSPGTVARYERKHSTLAPLFDRLGLFEVYSAPWFAAIYLLLLVAVTGCVLPRCRRLWRTARAAPAAAPSTWSRIPHQVRGTHALPPEQMPPWRPEN